MTSCSELLFDVMSMVLETFNNQSLFKNSIISSKADETAKT